MNIFGKLSWSAIPINEPEDLIASGLMILAAIGVLAWVTVKGRWPYLWQEWLTSVDHKRIGVMYCILALLMLLRGFADAIMMRTQQALAAGGAQGYLPPEHYDQIFSAHGTIMIFFMAMPFIIGLMNFAVPLQLGIRDVAFPTLNSVSLGLTASGILLTNISLVIGEFAKTGWVAYPPLSELRFSPGVGVDYYLWALQISGIGTLLTGINFVTTILKMRAPGMSYMRMPVFCWTALATNLLIVAAFPILTATFAMLLLDRYLGFHFFTTSASNSGAEQGGSPRYEPIEMPKNSATGFVTAFFAVVTGFALIWHIWWMAMLGVLGAFVTILAFAWRERAEIEIPAAVIEREDRAYREELSR